MTRGSSASPSSPAHPTPAARAVPSNGADRPVPPAAWRLVAALAVTQTVGYGVLSYAFTVLLVPMQQALDAGPVAVTGAMTVALLAGAAAAVPVGRWLDRHGGRALMTGGSLAATGLVVAWSQVRTVVELYLVFLGVGVVSAAVLYEAAFAVVVSWFPASRRAGALLAVTVVAGFASSIFLPLTGALVEGLGWRTALLVLAAVHGGVTIPLHLLVHRAPHAPAGRPSGRTRPARDVVRRALADRGYWLLAGIFVAQGAAVSTMSVHLVAFLRDLGHPATFAAGVAGLLGVLSVSGRLATTTAGRRWRAEHVTAAVFAVDAVGALVLTVFGATVGGAVGGVVAFGIGFGVGTIARPLLLANRYGVTGYATIAGILTVPLTVVKALAPLAAGAARAATGSYTAVGLGTGAACVLASVGLVQLARLPAPDRER